jgi:hypothetical protein
VHDWRWLIVVFVLFAVYSRHTVQATQIRDDIAKGELQTRDDSVYPTVQVCRWLSLLLSALAFLAFVIGLPFQLSVLAFVLAWCLFTAARRHMSAWMPIGATLAALICGLLTGLVRGADEAMLGAVGGLALAGVVLVLQAFAKRHLVGSGDSDRVE